MRTKQLGHDGEVLEGEFADISDLQDDIDAQMDAIIGEFAGESGIDSKIKVYKIEKGKRNWAFDCVPEELPILERVRDIYGPGDYVSRVYVNGTLKKALPFSIAAPRHPFQEIVREQKPTQNDGLTQSINALRDLLLDREKEKPNMFEMQLQFMRQMAAMKDLFGGGGGGSPIKDLREMMGLVDELRGEKQPENSNGVVGLLNNLMEAALPALSRAAEVNESNQQAGKRLMNPAPRKTTENKESNNMQLKMQLAFLCSMAKQMAEPSTYAGLIIDQCKPEQLRQLIMILENVDWLERLSQTHRPVLSYSEWFERVRDLILEEVNELESDELDVGQGDDDNPGEMIRESVKNVHSPAENRD